MPLTTTTFHAIRDQMATKIALITPSFVPERKFARSKRRATLGAWVQSAAKGEALFRAFEVVRGDGEGEPIHIDASALLRTMAVTVNVAYPMLLAIYGSADLDDVEKVVRSDAAQIRDVLFSSGNYVAGQQAAFPQPLPEPDRSDPDVWLQSIPINVVFYESETLV